MEYSSVGRVFGPPASPDYFMFSHHMALTLLQRLSVFVSMTLSFMRTLTILLPFRKIPSSKVYAACSIYGGVMATLQVFGGAVDPRSRECVATNVFILSPDNLSFFSIFYVMPFLIAGLVVLASIVIATWKLNLKKNRYSNQMRESKVRREMTATIRLVGLIFLLSNLGYPSFLIYLTSQDTLRGALSSRPHFVWAAYFLGSVMSFFDAGVTPIVLSVRGSQLKRVHRENLQRALKRISSRRHAPAGSQPDRLTLQFLAASSMQLSSLYQEVVSASVQTNVRRNVRRTSWDQGRVVNCVESAVKHLPILSEESETSNSQSGIQATVC